MAERKEEDRERPAGSRDRDTAKDQPRKRGEYVAGADGDQDVDSSAAESAETFRPDKDGTGW